MIESTIIALREGIEIALVLGILIVYLKKINQISLMTSAYAGLVLAVLASIAGAVILQRLGIDQESLEGYFMLAAALFVMSMIAWMWVASKKIRGEIEQKVDSIVSSAATWRAHAGILLFTFLMILREGIETAIFIQAVALSAGAWRSILGTFCGVTLAAVFAVLFIRGSISVNIGKFLKVTAVTLIIFTVQLMINAVHEFYEYGVFPANPRMMGILGPIVQNDALFVLAIVSIPVLFFMIPGKRTAPAGTSRRWQLSAGLTSIAVILFLGVGDIFSSGSSMDLSSEFLAVPGSGLLQIPVQSISDRALHRYSIRDNGLEIRFFILRTGVSSFATAFDACYACYSYGRFYLKNGELVCSQCDAPSPLSRLSPALNDELVDENNTGSMEGNGCSPIHLQSRLRQGFIEIRLKDLQRQRKYFQISEE